LRGKIGRLDDENETDLGGRESCLETEMNSWTIIHLDGKSDRVSLAALGTQRYLERA
jgi:hypothetical protein